LTKRTAWADNEIILALAYKLMSMKENRRGNIIEQAAIFNALADPTRLRLVRLLCRQREPDALCVNALAALLGVTQSAVSQHIRILKSAGLVKGLRRGYHIHYFINQDALERWREEILETLTIEEQNPAGESCSKYCHRKAQQERESRT
jgi:ArsR family transcriptional regulator